MRIIFAFVLALAFALTGNAATAAPDQVKPDQTKPDQVKLVKPDQAKPDQVKPDQVKSGKHKHYHVRYARSGYKYVCVKTGLRHNRHQYA
jgi:hypothetical protein